MFKVRGELRQRAAQGKGCCFSSLIAGLPYTSVIRPPGCRGVVSIIPALETMSVNMYIETGDEHVLLNRVMIVRYVLYE